MDLEAFLLSAEWRDTARGLELTLWARAAEGPVRALIRGQESVMFVPRGTRIQGGRQVSRALRTLDGLLLGHVGPPFARIRSSVRRFGRHRRT